LTCAANSLTTAPYELESLSSKNSKFSILIKRPTNISYQQQDWFSGVRLGRIVIRYKRKSPRALALAQSVDNAQTNS